MNDSRRRIVCECLREISAVHSGAEPVGHQAGLGPVLDENQPAPLRELGHQFTIWRAVRVDIRIEDQNHASSIVTDGTVAAQ